MTDLVQRLRERDADTGYHLRSTAADRIEWLEKQVLECGIGAGCCSQAIRIEQLETALSECRDAFTAPESEVEHAWSQAMTAVDELCDEQMDAAIDEAMKS